MILEVNKMQRWLEKWKSYKYRFVPWIALNFKNRTVREVPSTAQDKIASDAQLLSTLTTYLEALHEHEAKTKGLDNKRLAALDIIKHVLGYKIELQTSSLPGAGRGVFITSGVIPRGELVALYPGTIYWPYDPIMFQSIANQFVFRCIDGIHIDGNDSGLSKIIYRSSGRRDMLGPYIACDLSWLDRTFLNPLAVGQYVNNGSRMHPANVAYQELDIHLADIPVKLLKYIPNVWYGAENIGRTNSYIRTVALVSNREIKEGEEVFSSYFTVVH